MKKLIFLFTSILLICFVGVNAQDIHRVDEIEIANSQANNITVQIKNAEFGYALLSRVSQSNVNAKGGFNAQLNADNTILSLNFTSQFTRDELKTLMTYSGLELKEEVFNQLHNLINQ